MSWNLLIIIISYFIQINNYFLKEIHTYVNAGYCFIVRKIFKTRTSIRISIKLLFNNTILVVYN